MQIREQGRKIQFIRSEYQPELKRSTSKVITSCAKYATALSEEELELLTPEERAQAKAYFEKRQQDNANWRRNYSVQSLHEALQQTIAHLKEGNQLDAAYADSLWQAMAVLQKGLKKAGHVKPVRPKSINK
ncbi:hypothetical protein E9531_14360 [Lampropedia puyangensis]|uniref:Uncharacterized protein n=1 Tax=Lampropedia puyangensis TaxID=1330072 RepID=A0A4S8EWZ9_9BURK|nr:hypothetical protein [Lampropedia puyangensis]THT98394.1 hypothetical protein E9531_14360 [Lampropedia puyangensis]